MTIRLRAYALLTFLTGAAIMTGCSQAPPANLSPAAGTRVFEMRTYTAHPGKLADLQARFRDHTVRLFEKHGMTNVGYWVPQDAPRKDNTLIYIVSHESREAAARNWKAFSSDPEWQKVRAASEVNGPIVQKGGVESVFLTSVDYSAIK